MDGWFKWLLITLVVILAAAATATVLIVTTSLSDTRADVERNREVGYDNQYRLDTLLCLAAIPPSDKTPAAIAACYEEGP